MKKYTKKLVSSLIALTIATSSVAPLAAVNVQHAQASKITGRDIADIGLLIGGAKIIHGMYNIGRAGNNLDAAQYNRRANKINRMHMVVTHYGYNYIYNRRGKVIKYKNKPVWVPAGTILKHPKGTYYIHGKAYYYFGKGIFFPKAGTNPYRIEKKKYIPTMGHIFGTLLKGWIKRNA